MTTGPLGDGLRRDYGEKLERFARFAAPELQDVLNGLGIRPGDRILDVGCGTGMVCRWLAERAGAAGLVVGLDVSLLHGVRALARIEAVVVADAAAAPFAPGTFDLVWACNTVNHFGDPPAGVHSLSRLLRPGGRLAVAQSGLLPEMFFAWDASLERAVTDACHRYYRERYGLTPGDTGGVRAVVGLLRRAGLLNVKARTEVIERTAPLGSTDEEYLLETVFRGYWSESVRGYLEPRDRDRLERLCDPASPEYCLRRPDFHHLQTFTLVVGSADR